MIKKVSEEIYRGSRPSDKDIALLKIKNIKTILDLEDEMDIVAHEKLIALNLDIDFRSEAMSEIKKPSKEHLSRIVRRIYQLEKPIFIHCKHGHERTGIVIAYYRMKVEGWSKWKAIKEALQKGFSPLFLWWFI